jgi:hypothetical protein
VVANITSSRVSRERMRKVGSSRRAATSRSTSPRATASSTGSEGDVDLATLAKGPLALEAFVERIPLEAPEGEPLRLEFESFIAAVRGEQPVVVTGQDGREALAVALRIVKEIERTLPSLAGMGSPGQRVRARSRVREVLIIAGEASGDLHASGFAAALKRIRPDLTLTGVGGARMESGGVTLLERSDRMAVMGFVEVIRQVPRHYALLSSLKRRLRSGAVALLVVIDYPGFNMKLAAAAAAAGVPVLYYIHAAGMGVGRRETCAVVADRDARGADPPFEESLLRAHGINATFVGHPLLDRIGEMPDRVEARRMLGLKESDEVLALFPGSRAQEIDRHLDDFVRTAQVLEADGQGCASSSAPRPR